MAKDTTPIHKIVMLQDARGSLDGKVVDIFKCGKEYTLPEHLFQSFREMGVIKLAEEKETKVEVPEVKEPVVETKVVEPEVKKPKKETKKRGRKPKK